MKQKQFLKDTKILIASVAAGFPAGQTPMTQVRLGHIFRLLSFCLAFYYIELSVFVISGVPVHMRLPGCYTEAC